MMNLCSPTTIRTLMSEAGIRFRKDFGQNFLIDPAVPQRIAQACADDEDTLILEIGPGVGCLTQQLALRYRRVVALEIDAGLIPVLERTVGEFRHVTVYREDVMKADLPALLKQSVPDRQPGIDMTVSVCANLPYYITTPILVRLLTCGINFSAITVMVQKEVADRLTAAPGSRDYGAITAVTGYYGQARKLFTVPAGCFLPAPKVNSAVLRIDLFKQTPFVPKDEGLLFRTIRAAFEMRRKTLVNALAAAFPEMGKEHLGGLVRETGFPEQVRGECLSTADFVRLADLIHDALREN